MLNKLVYDNTGADKFITFFFGIFNCDDNTFEYINAGHNPPVLIKKNKIHYLKEGGLILGILEDEIDYEIGKISLFTGDRILFYTDGITEAMNSNEDEFGEDRLISILGNVDSISSEEMVQKIYKDVMEFCEHTEMLYDDITMIALRMT